MDVFRDRVAIVTGGASGIGRALGAALVQQGAVVVLADINRDGVETAARELAATGRVGAATLDVGDADAVARLVADTAALHGRLDYLFNNAGIAVMGPARRMAESDWGQLIDVNIRGVVHGVAAAYPLMIRQGFGHIVNTASLAGLVPTPGATGYALTKHAVVGLSTSLRLEAAPLGVKVSVVCPGLIDTPIKYATRLLGPDRDALLRSVPPLYPVDACARDILRGVAGNQAVIVVTRLAKLTWWLYRLAPRRMLWLLQYASDRGPLMRGGDER